MDTFRLISFTACFLGIVITIFDVLYPSDKYKKQIKMIFSLIFVLTLAKPISLLEFNLPMIEETVTVNTQHFSELSSNTDAYFIQSIENNISNVLKTKLNEIEVSTQQIETSINILENNSICITEVKITLDDIQYAERVRKCIIENTDSNVSVVINEKEGKQIE